MKVQVPKNVGDELRIEVETSHELSYLRSIITRIHFVYNPTYVYYVNGVRIEGKEVINDN